MGHRAGPHRTHHDRRQSLPDRDGAGVGSSPPPPAAQRPALRPPQPLPAPPRPPARLAPTPPASAPSCLQTQPTAALPAQNARALLFPSPSPLALRNQLPQRRCLLIPSGLHPSRLARQQLPLALRIALQPLHKGLHPPAHRSPLHRPARRRIGLLQPMPRLSVVLRPIPRLRAPAALRVSSP